MKKPKTITLIIVGFIFCLLAPNMMVGVDCLRPAKDATGAQVFRPDGKMLMEADTWGNIKVQWLSELLAAIGLICLIWAATRGARYLYDRFY